MLESSKISASTEDMVEMLFISQCHQLVYKSWLQKKEQHGLVGIKLLLHQQYFPRP